jgi:hypothetical protein
MLVLAEKPEKLIDAVIDDPGLKQMARNSWKSPWEERLRNDRSLRRRIKGYFSAATRMFTNEGSARRAVVVQTGADYFIYARGNKTYAQVMRDLYAPNVEPDVAFPDRGMRRYWDKWAKGRPYMHVHGPYGAWKRGLEAGFKPWWPRRHSAEKRRRKMRRGDARTWYVTGRPRFASRVKHKCRAVEGSDELLPLILRGVEYGRPAKDYLRECLLLGPSFVCEVKGEPVCWAGTHRNGTMGMIYTPPEYRRKGYALSLAAFQIDYMLRRDGTAVAHVLFGNKASENLLLSFGAKHSPGTMTWRTLVWPRWKRKKLKR